MIALTFSEVDNCDGGSRRSKVQYDWSSQQRGPAASISYRDRWYGLIVRCREMGSRNFPA